MYQNVRLKVSPPWITTINKIQAMFDGDPQIACNVQWNGNNPEIILACNNGDKVSAIKQLLPKKQYFGNVVLTIGVDGPEFNRGFTTPKEIFETAFSGNPAFAYVKAPAEKGYYYVDFTYVVFKNCVVQFFNDNLNDAHGVISTLYQDIAAELFSDSFKGRPVYYCTDVEDGKAFKADVVNKLGKPLGEWP